MSTLTILDGYIEFEGRRVAKILPNLAPTFLDRLEEFLEDIEDDLEEDAEFWASLEEWLKEHNAPLPSRLWPRWRRPLRPEDTP